MESEWTNEQMLQFAKDKIVEGRELILKLNDYNKIPGTVHTQNKITREIKFFQKAIDDGTLRLDNIRCSNLTHFDFVIKLLGLQRDIVSIDCAFAMEMRKNPLRVDIVCENGQLWIKAIARNAKGLDEAAKGQSGFGARNILDQAEDFMTVSGQQLCLFQRPKVVFYFSNKIGNGLREKLQAIGVEVASYEKPFNLNERIVLGSIGILNLDITTLLCYISAITNGSTNWIFQENLLNEQAKQELEMPVKPILDQFFESKRLICCQTAFKSFRDIVDRLAGSKERYRADELMKRVEILPDAEPIALELVKIKSSGKINKRSLQIFSFGMQQKAVTVTANFAFVRAVKMQGVNVPAFIHQARALTEAKEKTAKPLVYAIDQMGDVGAVNKTD